MNLYNNQNTYAMVNMTF